MNRIYVVTLTNTSYRTTTSKVIGATTDDTKICKVVADYFASLATATNKDFFDTAVSDITDDDKVSIDYLTDPNTKWYVADAPVGNCTTGCRGRFGIVVTVTNLD